MVEVSSKGDTELDIATTTVSLEFYKHIIRTALMPIFPEPCIKYTHHVVYSFERIMKSVFFLFSLGDTHCVSFFEALVTITLITFMPFKNVCNVAPKRGERSEFLWRWELK